ncbi:FecR domain-containing protein [Belliella sp. DSM 111904]|uniref:FecR domain-containing protein n=1 Tax=Belliella filtrata TaxID=2923435 RepID=A0ABS9UXN1_9BACT|nr:FecR domain-containing protein [Belliella filtrata]MCH7408935.1 FecR domain-containing protein [Belliella filtrata]
MNEDILIKYLLRETTPKQNAEIESWIRSNPAHTKQFEDMRKVWEISAKLTTKSTIDVNEAWERFTINRSEAIKPSKGNSRKFIRPYFQIAAAVFVILLVSVFAVSLLPHGGRAGILPVALTADSNTVRETLLDGSIVTLNKNSNMSYKQSFLGKERLVDLKKGEAYFEVKRNAKKPFIIQTEDVEIKVLGTSFNVKKTETLTTISVSEGSVNIASGINEVILLAGEKATVLHTTGEIKKSKQEDQLFQYYVSRIFKADNLPLTRLIEVLNEAYGTNIMIQSEKLQNLTITSVLKYDSLDENLEVISRTLNIKVTRENGKIILH